MVAAEIIKSQIHRGRRRELYYFRDHQGLEVDFVLPGRGGRLHLVEAKATATPHPSMAAPMQRLVAAIARGRDARRGIELAVVHARTRTSPATTALAPGVRALPLTDFVAELR